MFYHIHQTHHKIADFKQIFHDLKEDIKSSKEGIHVYPELYLSGYPLQDLCLQKSFIQEYNLFFKDLDNFVKSLPSEDHYYLVGGLDYQLTNSSLPLRIENSVFLISPGKEIKKVYSKRLLPNYDIFDEQKYFSAGNQVGHIEILGQKIGVLICEDMWSSSFHNIDPVADYFNYLRENQIDKIDIIINLSASPFHVGKHQKRIKRAEEIAKTFQCNFLYCNRVGAEDEIIFDGNSFLMSHNSKEPLSELKAFKQDIHPIKIQSDSGHIQDYISTPANTWEDLFNSRLESKKTELPALTDNECQLIIDALIFGFQEYANKSNFKKFTIALSGGIDSSLVLTIVKMALTNEQTLEAIYMPSQFSSSLSYDLSYQLCQNLNIPLKTLPIKYLHSCTKNLFQDTFSRPLQGLADENVQSRLRGLLIYTRSNQIGSMVINTSNKSEIATGYSTQYGDSVGAISILGDLFKSEVYQVAEYINKKHKNIIPVQIIQRAPSAELRENQIDTDSLPPYPTLDAILENILSYRSSLTDLLAKGFTQEDVEKVFKLYQANEFKRYQFCPILKISSKSFGFGYRIPISKSSDFYLEK